MGNRTPLCCLNTVTLRPLAMPQAIRLTAQAGFGGVGLWIQDIDAWLSAGRSLSELKDTLDRATLTAVEICFVGGWQDAFGSALDEALSEAERIFKIARHLGCGCVVAVPSMTRDGERRRSVENFMRLCGAAAQYDVRVALEFVGTAEEIRTLDAAWRLVDEANCENGGLLITRSNCISSRSSVCRGSASVSPSLMSASRIPWNNRFILQIVHTFPFNSCPYTRKSRSSPPVSATYSRDRINIPPEPQHGSYTVMPCAGSSSRTINRTTSRGV